MNEMVYVIEAKGLERMAGLQSSALSKDRLDLVGLNAAVLEGFFIDRAEAENKPMYKQIIPYVVIRAQDGTTLCYQRTGSEQRLAGKVSIGFGGHINPVDAEKIDYRNQMLWKAMDRELEEELILSELTVQDILDKTNFYALLYNSKSEDLVDKVHLGVIYLTTLPNESKLSIQIASEGKDLAWKTNEELRGCENLENWSKVILNG